MTKAARLRPKQSVYISHPVRSPILVDGTPPVTNLGVRLRYCLEGD
jgi:hypothetical protein